MTGFFEGFGAGHGAGQGAGRRRRLPGAEGATGRPGPRAGRRGPRVFAKFEDLDGPPWGGHGPGHMHGHGHGHVHDGPPWRGGRRMRRGDIRWALLLGLLDGPAHGYELIGRLEARSGGMWRPSAGSVYPTLQLLEDEGLVVGRDEGGKRVFDLTDDGRRQADGARERLAASGAWADTPSGPHFELRKGLKTLMLAARQVGVAGDDAQVSAAVAAIHEARQRIYRILAGDPDPASEPTSEPDGGTHPGGTHPGGTQPGGDPGNPAPDRP